MLPPSPIATPIPEGADPADVVPLALRAFEAIERKDYALAVGLALMVLTFFATRLAAARVLVPKEYTSSVLLGAAVLGGFGAALAGGVPPGRAVLACLACSASAIAFWEGVAKHVIRRVRRSRTKHLRRTAVLLLPIGFLCFAAPAGAAERIEPGVVLVRPDGTEFRIEEEAFLLRDEDVARLDEFVRELQACREERANCEARPSEQKPARKWIFAAMLAGAFVAGFCAERQRTGAATPEECLGSFRP